MPRGSLVAGPIAAVARRYNKSLARKAVAEYAKVAQKHGVSCTQLALAWCKSRWNVTSTIIGATTMDQLKVGRQRLTHHLPLLPPSLPTCQHEEEWRSVIHLTGSHKYFV